MKCFHNTRFLLCIATTILFCRLSAQNWNVFNKNYRYNYQLDTALVITNVLFQESAVKIGSDSVYTLNTVVRRCNGPCFGASVALYGAVDNMPQFLERNIIKYSSGLVMLSDPDKLVIKPDCQPSQSWLFDSIANYTATCTAAAIKTIFGQNDSVKTIVVGAGDTIELSKSFGIVRFPMLYGKNRNYILVGIERRYSYDSVSLYGKKVPNAWDMYNYLPGDIICSCGSYNRNIGSSQTHQCFLAQHVVNSKTVTAQGYIYDVDVYIENRIEAFSSQPIYCGNLTHTNTIVSFGNLTSDALPQNLLYPGKLYYGVGDPGNAQSFDFFGPYVSSGSLRNVITFAKGPSGEICKVMGFSYLGFPGCPIPNVGLYGPYTSLWYSSQSGPYTVYGPYGNWNSYTAFDGRWGLIGRIQTISEAKSTGFKTCFIRNGVKLFGEPYLSVGEMKKLKKIITLFPNPASGTCHLSLPERLEQKSTTLKIRNLVGQTVYETTINANYDIDTKDLSSGIYFVELYSNSQRLDSEKLIVEQR